MDAALQDTLGIARRQLRHAGLQRDDLQTALRELAFRSSDVGAGTQLQIQQTRQAAHGQIQDLLASQGQAEQGLLSDMQTARAERQQDLADEERKRHNDFIDQIKLEEAMKNLGLGTYAGGAGGLTPTQRREQHAEAENARFHAKNLFQALRGSGKVDEDPSKWDDAQWNELISATQGMEGVNDVASAEKAISAIRDHFSGGSTGDILGALGTIAKGTALPIGASLLSEAITGRRRRR